jgi:hypothetical protein
VDRNQLKPPVLHRQGPFCTVPLWAEAAAFEELGLGRAQMGSSQFRSSQSGYTVNSYYIYILIYIYRCINIYICIYVYNVCVCGYDSGYNNDNNGYYNGYYNGCNNGYNYN